MKKLINFVQKVYLRKLYKFRKEIKILKIKKNFNISVVFGTNEKLVFKLVIK